MTGDEQANRLRRVLQDDHGPQACSRCLAQLDGYIDAQLAGEDYLGRFPEVVGHLDACLECADAYARLYELEVAARAGTLPQGTVPAADLSFLAEAGTKPSSSLAEQLGQALRRGADGWTLQFSQALLGWLRPGLQPAAGLRSGEQARYDEVLYQLAAQEAAGAEPAFSLVVYRDAHAPERGLVEVRVEPEGRSWPDLGGYRVTLEAGGEARTMLTDAWGLASLENVALDGLMQAKLKIEAPARE